MAHLGLTDLLQYEGSSRCATFNTKWDFVKVRFIRYPFQLKQEGWRHERVLFQAFSHRTRILFARRDSSKQSFVAASRMNFGKKNKKKTNFTMRRYHMIIAFLFFFCQAGQTHQMWPMRRVNFRRRCRIGNTSAPLHLSLRS